MIYIHYSACISPQKSFPDQALDELQVASENRLKAIEPSYKGIPPGQLRRMGKAVRLGVGAAMAVLDQTNEVSGIIIGTANGGMEDCIKFLNQIIEYDEGALTPTNFVQSTTNAIASQVAFLNSNKGYNITHVQRGHAFENAVMDAMMHAGENKTQTFLLGGVDEISEYNYNIDFLRGVYKKEEIRNEELYFSKTEGTIAGEGAAMFLVNGIQKDSFACIRDLVIFNGTDEKKISDTLSFFLEKNRLNPGDIDLFFSGECGDIRYLQVYHSIEELLGESIPVARFKHATGEFATSSALAVWMACHCIQTGKLPVHMMKKGMQKDRTRRILIYNSFLGKQHSFYLIEAAN